MIENLIQNLIASKPWGNALFLIRELHQLVFIGS